MLATAFKIAAYAIAPKATFAVRHPVTAVQLKKVPFDLKHAFAPRITALGAAALAVPLGMWIGRRMDGYGPRREEILRRTERPGAL